MNGEDFAAWVARVRAYREGLSPAEKLRVVERLSHWWDRFVGEEPDAAL